MLLRCKGGPFTHNLKDEIEAITNRATLHSRDIEYDQNSRIVQIPITRFPITKKKKFLRKVTPYKQDKANGIDSLITIRNVKQFLPEEHLPSDYDDPVTLLFGIQVKEEEIYLSSAEEDRGTPLFQLTLEIEELDIEIKDT